MEKYGTFPFSISVNDGVKRVLKDQAEVEGGQYYGFWYFGSATHILIGVRRANGTERA